MVTYFQNSNEFPFLEMIKNLAIWQIHKDYNQSVHLSSTIQSQTISFFKHSLEMAKETCELSL